ncbi:hypothetical protein FQ187_20020 [Pseudomonas sp. ANT_J28]|nr:hypothetical protein FQ187_20020 [Pseudomonas sp. ANT_J28]
MVARPALCRRLRLRWPDRRLREQARSHIGPVMCMQSMHQHKSPVGAGLLANGAPQIPLNPPQISLLREHHTVMQVGYISSCPGPHDGCVQKRDIFC